MPLPTLYFTFCVIGALTFGGGYAMLPLFQHKLVDESALISPADFSSMAALSQLTPGAIGINMATFIGYQQAGFSGAIAGSLGLLTPALIITMAAAFGLEKFRKSRVMNAALSGVNPAVFGLIFSALIFFFTHSALRAEIIEQITRGESSWSESFPQVCDYRGMLIFGGALILAGKSKISAPLVLLLAAVAGIALNF